MTEKSVADDRRKPTLEECGTFQKRTHELFSRFNAGALGIKHVLGCLQRMIEELVFPVKVGGMKTTEMLVKEGAYNYSNPDINSGRFSITSSEESEDELVAFKLDYNWTEEQGLAELAKRELDRPTYEHALQFGVQHPEVQREKWLVFLHSPVVGSDGRSCVAVLSGGSGYRYLDLDGVRRKWGSNYWLVGVRKKVLKPSST